MPSYRTGRVVALLDARRGLQRVHVDLGGDAPERAYVLTHLIGEVALGDDVVVNTTAVELGLGTGGWHVVHWNLSRTEWVRPGPGHIMKLRYTSLQVDVGSAEEHHPEQLAAATTIDGMPVVACGLHSQVAAAVAAAHEARPRLRVAYLMTDGGALPLALSDLVAALRDRGLLATTITCGHAFGGEHETVSIHAGLAVARHVARADIVVAGIGPGIVGTGTRLGHTGLDVATILDATAALGGMPVAALRASHADPRSRHQGLSHHSATALGLATRARVVVAVPRGPGLDTAGLHAALREAGISARHDVRDVDVDDAVAILERAGLAVTSMGRAASDERVLFACAEAAARCAAQALP